jgi:hypothetical protein
MMRGDAAEEVLLERAAALVRQHHIDSDDQLGPLFQSPEPADPEVIRRLRQMFEAGGSSRPLPICRRISGGCSNRAP